MELNNMSTIPDGNASSDAVNQEQNIMSAFDLPQENAEPLADQGTREDVLSSFTKEANIQSDDEIDPRFANLPKAEALLRTYQSRYDKLYNEYQKTINEIENYRKYQNLFEQLLNDDEVFEAFVYQRKPELVKEQDITEIIKAKIQEEFGDYKPSREEAEEDPGGKAWLYYKRLDELYEEYKNKRSKKYSFEEILKKKAEERLQQEKAIQEEIVKVKEQMKWDDRQLVSFRDWASKLTVLDLAKIYNYAIRNFKVPQASAISSNNVQPTTARDEFLRSFKTVVIEP